jgi:hypothetical protein
MTDRVRSEQENVGEDRSRNQQALDAAEAAASGRTTPSASRDQAPTDRRASSSAGLTDRERNEQWPVG